MLITQKENGVESLRRIPLAKFFAELYDARKDNPDASGQEVEYGSVGEFIRNLSHKISTADLDVDLSNLDLIEEDGILYVYDNAKQLKYGEGWTIRGGGGGSSTGAIMKLANLMGTTSVPSAFGHDVDIRFKFTSVDDETHMATGSGSATYTINGTVVEISAIEQGEQTYTVKASQLREGTNTFKVEVVDAYSTTRSLTWTIVAKAIDLTCNLDDTAIFTEAVMIRYTPIGADISKTTTFELDGAVIETAVTTDTNLAKTYTLPMQTHGNHVLKIWTSATINGVTVTSDVLTYHMIFVVSGDNTPIVSVKEFTTPKQFTATTIPYMVYDPLGLITTVTLAEDGTTVSTLSVDRSLQKWIYKPITTGAKTLTITCRTAVETLSITVQDSGVDVTAVEEGLMWCFDPAGRSNAEEGRAEWSDGTVSMTVSQGFHWGHGGWGADENGYPCFTVPAGDTITISAMPFTTDWKRNGHLFKFVFKAVNVRDYNAKVMSCMSGNIGMEIRAQSAVMKSEQAQMVLPLCEEKYTELEYNITSTNHFREMTGWVQGIPSAVEIYAENDSFVQADPVPIVIGSPDCDVRIYKMREYSSYLTDEEMFSNWIADSPSGEEMLDRFERNKVVDDYGHLDPEKLADVCPDLRVITLTCPRFTTGKKDTVQGCTIRHVMKSGGAEHCWTATSCEHKGQGTSSEGYGDSSRNLDFSFPNGFELDNGTHIEKYAMTDQSIGVNYFNLKVNVASSENLNNAFLAREYQRWNPYLRPARLEDNRVRDTMEFHPAVIFVQDLSGELFGDTKMHFYSAGDLGNSKKNHEAQGLGTTEQECIVELLNNTADVCRWKSDDLSNELWDGDGAVEFRYPKVPNDAMKASFQRVLSWVVSTDPLQATESVLPAPVDYGGTVYRTDSAEYRKAKFIHEFDDYFISDSVAFFYCFTDRRSLVDNRAKNTFWHTLDGLHWDLSMDYDNDTAMGNDNEGGLTLTYGLNDDDQIGTKDVFNAADSVLFCNFRDCFWDRLVAMYQRMETVGAWDSRRFLLEAEAYQAVKPERLWVADMRRKYLRPYEDLQITSYLPMMHGTKVLQRAQYEKYQEVYCASKYLSSKCTSDIITLRGYTPTDYGEGITPNGDITITMYQDCYIGVKFGSNVVTQRAKRGVATKITCPIDRMNDTEIYLYTASRIQQIGDLSALYVGYCNFGSAVKLQSLVVSNMSVGYSNTNMTDIDLGNCKLLQTLSICCCPNLTVPLTFAGCPSLKTVDLRASGVTGVTFATDGYLESASLPASIASITAKKLDSLETLTFEGYSALRTLDMEYCNAVDSLAIITAATGLTRVRLIDVDWVAENGEAIVRLINCGGIDDSGFDIVKAVCTGAAHITTIGPTKVSQLEEAFPSLTVTYDSLAQEHTVRFLQDDGTVLDTQLVEHGYAAEDPVTRAVNPIPTPTKEPTAYKTFTYAGWGGTFNNILQDVDIRPIYAEAVRMYTVVWYSDHVEVQRGEYEAGSDAEYTGADLVKQGQIWTGWDLSSKNVLSDLNLTATFVAPALPPEKLDTSLYDFVYSDDPNDNMAYNFAEFVGIITAGFASEYFLPYDKIKIVNIHDAITDESIILSLHSFGHYQLGDGTGLAQTTWYMVGLLDKNHVWNPGSDNAGGYLRSSIDDYVENTIFQSLPCHWRSIINPVQILANVGNQSLNVHNEERHLYLPSYAELFSDVAATAPYKDEICAEAQEITFSRYTGNSQRIKKYKNNTGAANYYWTRSADVGSLSSVRYVYLLGTTDTTPASTSYGVCFGLSISKINASA